MSVALSNAIVDGTITGVPIPKTRDDYTHGQFVDDTSYVNEAEPHFIENTLAIFREMGAML